MIPILIADFSGSIPYLVQNFLTFWIIWAIIMAIFGLLWAWLRHCRPFKTRLEDCQRGYDKLEAEHKAQLDRTAQLRSRLIDTAHEERYQALELRLNDTVRTKDRELDDFNVRFNSLQGDLGSRDEELAALRLSTEKDQEDLGKFRLDLEKRDSELEGLRLNLGNLEKDVSGRDKELNELRSNLASRDKDLEGLRLKLTNLEKEKHDESSKFDGLISGLRSSLTEKDDEVSNLGLRIGGFEKDLGDRDGELNELRGKLGDRDKELSNLKGKLGTVDGEIGDLKGQLSERDDELGQLKARLSDRETEIESLRAQLGEIDSLKGQLSDRDGELNDLRAKLDSASGDLDGVRGEYDEFKLRFADIEGNLGARDEELGNLKLSLGEKDTELDGLREQLGELHVLRGDIGARDEELGSLKLSLGEKDSELDGLRGQVGELDELRGNLGARDEELGSLKLSLGEKDTELDELRGQVGELDELRGNLGARDEELGSLKLSLGEKDTELDGLREQIVELDELRESLSGRDDELNHLKVKFADAQEQISKREDELVELRTHLEGAHSTVEEKDGELDKLRGELDQAAASKEEALGDLNLRINELMGIRGDLESERGELQKQLESTQTAVTGKQESIDLLDGRVAELEGLLGDRDNELNDLRSQVEGANAGLDGKVAELATLTASFAALESQKKDSEDSINSLRLEIDGARNEGVERASALQAELDGLKADIQAREEELAKAHSLNADRERTVGEQNGQILELEDKLSIADKKLADLDKISAELQDLESERNGLKGQVKDLETQIGGANTKVGDLEGKIELAATQLRDTRSDADAAAGEAKDLRARLEAARAERENATQSVTKLEASLKDTNGKLSAAQDKASASADDLKGLKAQLAALQKERVGVDKQLSLLNGKLGDANAALGDAQSTSKASAAEIKDLRAQLAALQKQRDGLAGDADKLAQTQADLTETRNIAKKSESEILALKKQLARAQTDADKAKEMAAKAAAAPKAKPAPEPKAKPAPKKLAAKVPAKKGETVDPKLGLLYTERPKSVDDLKKISGVASVLEKRLNGFGVYRFKQIADWEQSNVDEFSERIGFKGRVERDRWIPQCRRLYDAKYLTKIDPKLGLIYTKKPSEVNDLAEIGPITAEQADALNKAGIYRYDQIAEWDSKQWAAWKAKLKLPANAKYEDWVLGARVLSEQAKGNTRFKVPEGSSYDPQLGFVYKRKPKTQDDLKEISGVGTVLENKLHDDGVYRFEQVANWNQSQVDAFNDRLSFKGRIERDQWIMQARRLHEGATLRKKDAQLGVVYTEEPTDSDDLTTIRGVDHKIEGGLNGIGVYQYDQVAGWNDKTAEAVGMRLGLPAGANPAAWSNDAATSYDAKYSTAVDDELGTVYSRRPSQVDDLKEIKGIANVLEGRLHDFGVYRFDQIANWEPSHVKAFSERIGFKDRVERDEWISQAQRLHEWKYLTTRDPKFGMLFLSKPGSVDKLTAMDGIDAGLEKELNKAGVYRFEQIAAWDSKQWAAWTKKIGFKGNYDDWLLNARLQHEAKFGNGKFVVIEGAKYDSRHGFYFDKKPAEIDDLKEISGVANVLEKELHKSGVYRFQQIAQWSDHQASEFGDDLSFPGRVQRDQWVLQARRLHEWKYLTEQDTEFGVIYSEAPTHPDELSRIKGLTPAHEAKLNSAGIYTFDQFSGWDDATAANVAKRTGVKEGVVAGWRTAAIDEYDLKYNATIDESLGLLFVRRPTRVDDLKRIYGVAGILEKEMHDFGVYWFSQVSNWSPTVVEEFCQRLTFKDRVYRDNWIGQCTVLKDADPSYVSKKPKPAKKAKK